MRTWCVLLALALLSVPPAAAQDDAFMQDDAGDHEARVAGETQAPPVDRYDHVDLSGLAWTEVGDGFIFTLEVADLTAPPAQNFQDSATYLIGFDFGGIDYAVLIERYIDVTGIPYEYAGLVELVEDNGYQYHNWRAQIDLTVDEAAGTFSGLVPRSAVNDPDGAPATVGDVLAEFMVTSSTVRIFSSGGLFGNDQTEYRVIDQMPDDGAGPSYEVQLGTQQSGDASLMSDDPYRLSNGGATSLVYQVHAHNAGERQSFRLSAQDVPEGWTVSLPFDRLVLDEDEGKDFPVLVTTQSGHQHGGAKKVLITMAGERDNGDVGRVELGIKFTDIPQPAGHHPKLWIHSHEPWANPLGDADIGFFGGPQPYMNALEEDPSDVGKPSPSWSTVVPGVETRHFWYVPLMPQIAMGLDFMTREEATMEVTIDYDYLVQDATLGATLHYQSPNQEVLVAQALPIDAVSWGPGEHAFELTLPIEEQADFLPYEKDARMYLELDLQGTFMGVGPFGPGAQPRLVGGWMELPLAEYHDRVDKFYQAVEGLQFGTDFLERPVNPGKTVLFQTHLRNAGSQDDRVQLNLTGVNADWARVLGDASFTIGSGKERQVAVAVEVPAGTPDGALADLILQAQSQDDPFRRAVIDLIAVVDDEAEHPDEAGKVAALSDELKEGKKSPGFEIAAIALGLLAMALLRRRRP